MGSIVGCRGGDGEERGRASGDRKIAGFYNWLLVSVKWNWVADQVWLIVHLSALLPSTFLFTCTSKHHTHIDTHGSTNTKKRHRHRCRRTLPLPKAKIPTFFLNTNIPKKENSELSSRLDSGDLKSPLSSISERSLFLFRQADLLPYPAKLLGFNWGNIVCKYSRVGV